MSSRTIPECRENEGDDYMRHRRGDSRWEGYRGSNDNFVFLGALITMYGLCEKEVRRRIAMGKAAMGVVLLIRMYH